MSNVKVIEKQLTAVLMGAVACFAFFALSISPAQAEETDGGEQMNGGREAMMEKVQTLRALIEARRGEVQENQAERKEERQENRAEYKEAQKENKTNFMASIADLEGEEKRAAIMEFMMSLRAQIEERKAAAEEMKAEVMDNRAERKEMRADAKADFKDMTREEKIAAIMARIAKLQSGNDMDESEDEEEIESEDSDETEESDDDSEDADESDDDSESEEGSDDEDDADEAVAAE